MAEGRKAADGQGLCLDLPGFAQEFLRRNPAYRRDYDSVMSEPHPDPAAREVMARRWGLSFPVRSASGCD